MKDTSILSTLVFGTARVVLFIVVAVNMAKEKAWLPFALCIVLALAALVLGLIQLIYLGQNEQKLWLFIPSVLFVSAIGGATYFLWKVNPTHTPGYVPPAQKHEEALDNVLGISEAK